MLRQASAAQKILSLALNSKRHGSLGNWWEIATKWPSDMCLNMGIDPPATTRASTRSITLRGIKETMKNKILREKFHLDAMLFVNPKLRLIGIRVKISGFNQPLTSYRAAMESPDHEDSRVCLARREMKDPEDSPVSQDPSDCRWDLVFRVGLIDLCFSHENSSSYIQE